MANSNNPYAFPAPHQDQSSFNQNYLQQPMPNPEHITDPITVMNMELALMGQNAGNPVGYNDIIGNQVLQNAVQNPRVQNVGNQNGLIGVQGNRNQNQIRNGNLVAARAEGNTARNQIRCYNCRGVEEYDLMAAAADLDEIKEVNANCILMANLQQASTSGTQTDSALIYDTDGSAEEAAKFVGDFKSLANEVDASLAKHKALKWEIELSTPPESKGVNNDKVIAPGMFRINPLKTYGEEKHVPNTDSSKNTKLAKQPIAEILSKIGETNALLKPVTSNSVSTPQVSKVVNNAKVIAPGMFRISPDKISREAKKVPNTVSASSRTKPITVSQPSVITKKGMNSNLNGLSST
nr:hypothetical protein [Tanacetum cinerariifolium]